MKESYYVLDLSADKTMSAKTYKKLQANITASGIDTKKACIASTQESATNVGVDLWFGEDVVFNDETVRQIECWFDKYVNLAFKRNGTEKCHAAATVDAAKRTVHCEDVKELSQSGKQAFKKACINAAKTLASKPNGGKANQPDPAKTGQQPNGGKTGQQPNGGKTGQQPNGGKTGQQSNSEKANQPDPAKTASSTSYDNIPDDDLIAWMFGKRDANGNLVEKPMATASAEESAKSLKALAQKRAK